MKGCAATCWPTYISAVLRLGEVDEVVVVHVLSVEQVAVLPLAQVLGVDAVGPEELLVGHAEGLTDGLSDQLGLRDGGQVMVSNADIIQLGLVINFSHPTVGMCILYLKPCHDIAHFPTYLQELKQSFLISYISLLVCLRVGGCEG